MRLSKVHQKVLNAELERKDDPVVQRLLIVKLFREQLEEGSVVLLPEMCKQYRETLVSLGIDPDVASHVRSFFKKKKKKMKSLFGKEISFYSQRDMPDVVCSNSLTVGTMMTKVNAIINSYQNLEYESPINVVFSN